MIRIIREYHKDYTIGKLISDKFKEILYTLELPYLDNKNNISCIPAGEYKLVKHNSPKFKKCFKILDVKNRSNILIHCGNSINEFKDSTGYNWTIESHGCILIGKSINKKEKYPILNFSRKALDIMLESLGDEEFLIIE